MKKTGQNIFLTQYANGFIADEYEVFPIIINNYQNTGNSGNTSGNFEKDISVEFYYISTLPKCFMTISYYLYGTNTQIKSDDILEGNINDSYKVAMVPTNGYYYYSHSGELNGIYTIDNQKVKL